MFRPIGEIVLTEADKLYELAVERAEQRGDHKCAAAMRAMWERYRKSREAADG